VQQAFLIGGFFDYPCLICYDILMKILKAFKDVFSHPSYIILAALGAFVIFAVANFMPNFGFLGAIVTGDLSIGYKLAIIWSMLDYVRTNSTLAPFVMIILVSILAGIDIALAIFYTRRKIVTDRAAGFGMLGIVGGFFGIGCSACGSVVLSSLIGVGASGQLVGILPLHGLEFSIASLIILIASIVYLAKHIENPKSCRIEK